MVMVGPLVTVMCVNENAMENKLFLEWLIGAAGQDEEGGLHLQMRHGRRAMGILANV